MLKKELEEKLNNLETRYDIIIKAFKIISKEYANRILVCPTNEMITKIEKIAINEVCQNDKNGKMGYKKSRNRKRK